MYIEIQLHKTAVGANLLSDQQAIVIWANFIFNDVAERSPDSNIYIDYRHYAKLY